MTFRAKFPRLALATALMAPGALAGCGGNEANTQEAQIAEKAVGVQPSKETKQTEKETRDVIVKKETIVTDKNTGQVLSDTVQETPVKITKEKVEKTDVKVDVGNTNTSGTNAKK